MVSPVALRHGLERADSVSGAVAPSVESFAPVSSLAKRLIRSILLERAAGSGRPIAAKEFELAAHLAASLATARRRHLKRLLDELFYRRDIARSTARALAPSAGADPDINLAVVSVACANRSDQDLSAWEETVARRHAGFRRSGGFRRSLREASDGVALYVALMSDDADAQKTRTHS